MAIAKVMTEQKGEWSTRDLAHYLKKPIWNAKTLVQQMRKMGLVEMKLYENDRTGVFETGNKPKYNYKFKFISGIDTLK